MSSILEWELFKEPYETKFNSGTILQGARIGLKRADGLSIMRTDNGGIGSLETFLVQGSFGEFKFFADRMEAERLPSDRYVVKVCLFHRGWPGNKEKNIQLIAAYSKEIEYALLHFPVGKLYNLPIKEVVFNTNEVTQRPHLVNAEEIAHVR